MNDQLKECCPRFDVERWDDKEFHWEQKSFIKASIPTFFHMPFPPMISSTIAKMWKMVEEAGAVAEDKESVLILFLDPTAFRSDIHISTTRVVPDADNVTLSGTFVAKVFDGGYNAIPKFIGQMNQFLAGQNKTAKEYYIHYAYCPKCAKKFGNNYMVLFARV